MVRPSRKTAHPRSVDANDKALGLKIRTRRMLAGMSQDTLAEALGVSFQQVQKYEKGVNRVTFNRLQVIANALGESLAYFTGTRGAATSVVADELAAAMADKFSIRLVRAYAKLPQDLQHRLVSLTESMVESAAA